MAADALGASNEIAERLLDNIETVVHGKREQIKLVVAALMCSGHALLEDVPGTAKTVLARAIAGSISGAHASRIQCTPDLQPTDVTGLSIFNQRERDFEFRPGPVFANVVLVDEINRAMPKTQSALLEAMAEQQVTVAGTTHALPSPFFVLATLNPIEMEGTYQLPEAQLDRFLFKVALEYPSRPELERILGDTTAAELPTVQPVLARDAAPARVEELRQLVRRVLVAPHIERYAADLVRLTHPGSDGEVPETVSRYVAYGASPRGGQALILGAKVLALLAGRVHVAVEDIDRVAPAALPHRLVINFAAEAASIRPPEIIAQVLAAGQRRRG